MQSQCAPVNSLQKYLQASMRTLLDHMHRAASVAATQGAPPESLAERTVEARAVFIYMHTASSGQCHACDRRSRSDISSAGLGAPWLGGICGRLVRHKAAVQLSAAAVLLLAPGVPVHPGGGTRRAVVVPGRVGKVTVKNEGVRDHSASRVPSAHTARAQSAFRTPAGSLLPRGKGHRRRPREG